MEITSVHGLTFLKRQGGRILLGGYLTYKILLEQGFPKGDMISSNIFIIAVEVLLIKITKSKHIKSIQMADKECSDQTIADDTSLLIQRL